MTNIYDLYDLGSDNESEVSKDTRYLAIAKVLVEDCVPFDSLIFDYGSGLGLLEKKLRCFGFDNFLLYDLRYPKDEDLCTNAVLNSEGELAVDVSEIKKCNVSISCSVIQDLGDNETFLDYMQWLIDPDYSILVVRVHDENNSVNYTSDLYTPTFEEVMEYYRPLLAEGELLVTRLPEPLTNNYLFRYRRT